MENITNGSEDGNLDLNSIGKNTLKLVEILTNEDLQDEVAYAKGVRLLREAIENSIDYFELPPIENPNIDVEYHRKVKRRKYYDALSKSNLDIIKTKIDNLSNERLKEHSLNYFDLIIIDSKRLRRILFFEDLGIGITKFFSEVTNYFRREG